MAITQVLSELENIPSIADPTTFEAKTEALLNQDLPQLIIEQNTLSGQMNTLAAAMNAAAAGGAYSITYTFSTTTTDADPGNGHVRLDNATQNAADAIRADLLDSLGNDWTTALSHLDDSTSDVKGYVRLEKVSDADKWLLFQIDGLTTPSGYVNIAVTAIAWSDTNPFANGDTVNLEFSRNGDKGQQGIQGDPGATFDGGTVTNPITLPGDPTNALHAASKQYVDAVAQGLNIKASVRAGTTANITLSGAQTIDGVSVIAGNRVLVKNQSTASQNGIYVVAAGSWSRAADMDAWAEVPSAFVFIEEGSTLADTGWVSTANSGGTLGSTSIPWTQFGAATSYTAGTGLALSGNTFSLDINGLTAETAPAISDTVPIYDASATAGRKMTLENFLKVINSLTEDTSPDAFADFLLAFDASAGTVKKVKPRNLKLPPSALTDGATVTPDFNTNLQFTWTIGGNRTLANPSNMQVGDTGYIEITQDGTGNRTLSVGSWWKFPGGATGRTLSTAAGAIDLITFTVITSSRIDATLTKAYA